MSGPPTFEAALRQGRRAAAEASEAYYEDSELYGLVHYWFNVKFKNRPRRTIMFSEQYSALTTAVRTAHGAADARERASFRVATDIGIHRDHIA